ncbi:MAG: A24 family peptidase [Clostridia bacterium]|nr:A24 family peptidase [Clostridia bacterium]
MNDPSIIGLNGTEDNAGLQVICFVSVSLLILCASFIISFFSMKKLDFKPRGYHKTVTAAMLLLTLLFSIITVLRYNFTAEALKGILLLSVLSYAGLSDLMTHTADNSLSVMILLIGLINFDPLIIVRRLASSILILVLFLTVSLISKKNIGGADIKISSSICFVLGITRTLAMLLIGFSTAVITMLLMSKMHKYDKSRPFALLPFIALGAAAGYLI